MYNDVNIDELINNMDLSKNPPMEEPLRQYWYIKQAREYVKKKSEELGRPLIATTKTLGCPYVVVTRILKCA